MSEYETMSQEELKAELKRIRAQLQYVFEDEITDENIRHFIFGKYGYDLKTIKATNEFPKYFKNILTLTYFFAFACYQRDLNEGFGDMDNVKGHVALRVKRYLEDSLATNPITMSLIEFVLSDIQTDLALGGSSELNATFSNLGTFDNGFNFQPYLKSISKYEESPNRFRASKLEMTVLLLRMVENLTFLKKYNLIEDAPGKFRFASDTCLKKQKLGIELSKSERYDELPVDHLFFKDSTLPGIIFRLYSLETGESSEGAVAQNLLRLRYVSTIGNQTRIFTVPGETGDSHLSDADPILLYEEIVAFEWNKHKELRSAGMDALSICQIHTVNYKYLKPLALAISDVLSDHDEAKRKLHGLFSKKYSYIFEQKRQMILSNETGSDQYDLLDWDSIIIMLLIEASPTVVLEAITQINRDLFYLICQDLYKRVYDVENLTLFKGTKDQIKAAIDAIIEKKLALMSKDSSFSKLSANQMRDKLFPKAASMLLLTKLNDLQNDDIEENLVYTGDLDTYLSLLKRTKEELDSEKQIKYSCIILGETIKRLICFYEGLIAYGEKKAPYDKQARCKSLDKDEIKKVQNKLEKVFLNAAETAASDFPSEPSRDPASALAILDQFCTLCKKCASLDNNKMSQHLVAAIGRFEIVDATRFGKFVQQLRTLNTPSLEQHAGKWLDVTLEMLEYFESGRTRKITMDDDLLNAVYPFTISFKKGKENLDGYKTVTFSLDIVMDEKNKEEEINVLSEFIYEPNEAYYCLPNIIRSNYKWWIDPVLVSFRKFNHILSAERKEDE